MSWRILEFVPTYHEWQNKQDEWVGNVGKPAPCLIMGCGGLILVDFISAVGEKYSTFTKG